MTPQSHHRRIPLNDRLPPSSIFDLAALHAAQPASTPERPAHRSRNRTEIIRRALRQGVDKSAAELARLSGLTQSKYVYALLKSDLMAGRVVKVSTRRGLCYRWNPTPPALSVSVTRQEAAARLLRACGWSVSAPSQRVEMKGGAA